VLDILDASSVLGLSEPKTGLRPLQSIKCAHAFVQNRGGQIRWRRIALRQEH
jgi:hypothetical protein